MVAVLLYSLAAVGGLALVGCAAILYGCVRIARQADCANHQRNVEDAGETTRDSETSLTGYTTFV